ncbi:hypothetical protein HK096_007186 [Nowakowskiella sp. JEL0078]|nr:hypothetical protein HK096_007186 [Nowakowskiella sp. JEL0078]
MSIAITGASGRLGKEILVSFYEKNLTTPIIALARDPAKVTTNFEVRKFDYDDEAESLKSALSGVSVLILISSSTIGTRTKHHKAAIEAAKAAGVHTIVYTSVLRAPTTTLAVAPEHKETEDVLKNSGLKYVLLRNGWYLENWTGGIAGSIAAGGILGSNKGAAVSPATRKDYADAATSAALLALAGKPVKSFYELGGTTFKFTEFAEEVSKHAGKPVHYVNLSEVDYKAKLVSFGLPEAFAGILAASDASAGEGGLLVESTDLEELIGRKPEDWRKHVEKSVKAVV